MVNNPLVNAGDVRPGFGPLVGRSPGRSLGNPLQYAHLGNSLDRGTCWALVHGVARESGVTEETVTHAGIAD